MAPGKLQADASPRLGRWTRVQREQVHNHFWFCAFDKAKIGVYNSIHF
jgi:hypothetical protein